MQDQILYCVQCESPFSFTVSEQKRLNSQGFDAPKRCPECRKKKQKNASSDNKRKKRNRRQREPWEMIENE